jgi:hypothetical protein
MYRCRRLRPGGRNPVLALLALRLQFPRDKTRFLTKKTRMFRSCAFAFACFLGASSVGAGLAPDLSTRVIISVLEQELMLVQNGVTIATYPVSTSKYGLGDRWGSLATPLGLLQVAQKIGDHAPMGAVFHNRRWTGEVLPPNVPGRDPVLTRIIWLRGLERSNAHAFRRCIYIHGTTEENSVGHPASYGCIRMKSGDVAALYSQLPLGALVQIVADRFPKTSKVVAPSAPVLNALAPEPKRVSIQASVRSGPRA